MFQESRVGGKQGVLQGLAARAKWSVTLRRGRSISNHWAAFSGGEGVRKKTTTQERKGDKKREKEKKNAKRGVEPRSQIQRQPKKQGGFPLRLKRDLKQM